MRIEALRQKMREDSLDLFLITDKINRRYLSGFTGSNGLLAITLTRTVLFIDGRYTVQANQQTNNVEIITVAVGRSLWNELQQFNEEKHWGYEASTISLSTYQQMQQAAQEVRAELISTRNLVESMRMLKEETEIAAMRVAAELSDATLHQVLDLIKPGMTELALANEIDYLSKKLGSEGPAFETIVASGVRTGQPHAHASQKVIEANELIMIDFGCIYQGYYSDITRTFALGNVAEKIVATYQTLQKIQAEAIETIRLDEPLSAIDQRVRKQLAKSDLDAYFTHNLGHGIGLSCHEYPTVGPEETQTVQESMVFTVEPGIYLPDFGIRIEDDVLINKSGEIECLTKFPKEWLVI